ncbi:MAG: M1 family metallopeptidase, partial [Lapillicoccus sp.]
ATVKSPASIRARTTISLTPDHPLSSIPLDFEGLTVDSVTVGGRPAAWSRSGHKIVVTPAAPVTDVVSLVVAYHGVPVTHIDPDGAEDGWVPTADGATVVSEPVGAMTWFPNNNTPRDKATYRVNVTVPNDLQVAGNGDLTRVSASPGRTTWRWAMHEPMASYLAMISIGRYRVYQSQMPYLGGLSSLPLWSFVDVTLGSRDQARVDLRDALRWEQKEFGLYPFDSSGIVIDVTGVGYALETQSRPVFDRTADRSTIVHEMAHQWFGDAVSLSDWGDIWLNEGFATYTEWLFAAAHGGPTTAQAFRAAYDAQPATSDFWTVAPHGLTDPAQLFSGPVYERGAMTLAALSQRIGAPTLQRVLRSWTLHHQGGTGTTAQFVALAEQISGAQLGPLFHRWLDVPTRPAFP